MPDSFILTVQHVQGSGTSEYSFDSGELTVGRADSCDIVLDSDRVSRLHATFSITGNFVTVRDLGSANGTFVNEKRISGSRELLFDDVVRIGDCSIIVRGGRLQPDRVGGTYLRLKGRTAGFTSTILEFSKSPSLVGRGDDVDLSIVDPSVSRQHAKVQRRHDGSVLIVDLSSANGIKVNRRSVGMCELVPGDLVSIGHVEFIAELPYAATVSGMSAVGFAASFARQLRSVTVMRILWIVAALAAAVALAVAGWRLGGFPGDFQDVTVGADSAAGDAVVEVVGADVAPVGDVIGSGELPASTSDD